METEFDNKLIDQFEEELKAGKSPEIESFLARWPEDLQQRILFELISIEVFHSVKKGRPVSNNDYARFGEEAKNHANRVEEQFSLKKIIGLNCDTREGNSSTAGSRNGGSILPPSQTVGPYTLVEQLGEGGMGTVWMARQDEPVKRRVALKLIKSELPSREILARFDAEKQALAMMDHPNIARVIDAGTTEEGRPYFVMELVDGISITEYCDANRLSVDERLMLFMPVCKAVQHAHQKGILHRDLKPSNVLVAEIDGTPVPKVIDFGMAKAIQPNLKLTDQTMYTAFGRIVGTLKYMSPEQAEMSTDDIDTRTDVYSLGVMLYELLSGSTPLDKETLVNQSFLKTLQTIREKDPPKPSSRLSASSVEAITNVGETRRITMAGLQKILKGDLDWVVMKAIEKDRTRRYQTVDEFLHDISSYLTGDAVRARPPSNWYQFQKFANRNRGLVVALLAIGVALLAGIAGTSYGLIRANQKTSLAETKTLEAESQRGKAVKATELATAESQRARDSEATAKFQLANARWDARRARDARDFLREIPSEYRDNFEWNFCNRQFDGSDFTCYGHWQAVRDVAFSSDGTRVATASDDRRIKLWDANTGREVGTLAGHQGRVSKVVFSPDGSSIASASSDMTIKIQDTKSGQTLATLEGHEHHITGLAFSADGEQVITVSMDGVVKRWDTLSGQEISTFKFTESVEAVAFSPDGKRIVSGGDSAIIIWDATTGQEIARQPHAVILARSVAFSPDGLHIAVAAHDIVTLWDGELTQELWIGNGKAGWIEGLSFSPDGTRVAAAGGDRLVRVWDVGSGAEIMALVGHGDEALGVVFSPDGARIATVGRDATLKLWDARTGQKPLSIRAHHSKVVGLALSHDGTRLASAGLDRSFRLSDLTSGQTIASRNGVSKIAGPAARCVAFSPDDAHIAFVGNDNAVKILDGRSGRELKSFNGHEGPIYTVAFAPDSRRFVSGGEDQTVILWDIDSGKQITGFKGHTARINGVSVSPDGTRIVSASDDLTIKVWDIQSRQEIMSLSGHLINIADVAFSPDGKQIASSGNDHTIRIWDARTGEEVYRMKGHIAGVTGVVFSPDGKRIASTSFDRSLKLWNTQTGQEIFTIEKNPYGFHGIAFSSGGQRIAAGSTSGIVMYFDAPCEREVTPLRGHTDDVIHFSFSEDGSQVYSESAKEKLFWDLTTKVRDPAANWEPPATHTQVSPDGRWLINGDRNNLLLIDLEYKNTPQEKAYRAAKAQFDPPWHREQAETATTEENWYAATFHFALLLKNAPDQATFYDGLQSSFQELESQFEQKKLDLDPHVSPVVKESLQLPRGSN